LPFIVFSHVDEMKGITRFLAAPDFGGCCVPDPFFGLIDQL